MASETEIKEKFWKSLKSDMTMFLGLAEGEDGHARPMTPQDPNVTTSLRVIPRDQHTVSRKDISPNALRVLYRLREGGFGAFLVSNLINRRFGPGPARRVAWIGFLVAVVLSVWVATPRIAIASCSAFIVAQLLDITVFDRLRRGSWWRAPMVATTCSATVDTTIFWSIAFAGSALPWVSWAAGDLAVKLAIGVCLLAPFRALLWKMAPLRATS